jgi:trigger factor
LRPVESLPETPPAEFPLQVSVESPTQWGRVLTIEFARGRYDEEYERVVRDLRKRVVRPGFRKGKVPRQLVERDFGERIRADVLQALIPDVCDRAFKQERLDVISTPSVRTLDLEHPDTVRLEVELDVRPRIEFAPLENLQAERWITHVTDADTEAALQRLRDQQAEFVAVDRQAVDGDFVNVTYVPLDDAGNPQVSQQVENYPFQLGQRQVVAEIESAVRGLAVGGTARADVRYEPDGNTPGDAGKLVALLLTVKEVKEKRLPDLDDELARDLGQQDLEQLRSRVRADLSRRQAEENDRMLVEKLVDGLIAANPFEAPQTVVQRFLEAMESDFEARYQRAHRTLADADRQTFRNAARPEAERAARRTLLLEAIRTQFQIEVSEEDVDRWIEERVQAGGSESGTIRAFFAEPNRRRRLRNEMLEHRVLEFVRSKATIREVPRPAEPGAPSDRVAEGD